MTERLYHDDAYQITFQGTIVSQYPHQGKYALILNRTCFYPESGGQTCDRGTIAGIQVLNVQEVNGNIIHYLPEELKANAGDKVNGEIDWPYRFDHMQQHSGQHILSGVLMDLWQRETQSFHMGEHYCTIDIPAIPFDDRVVSRLEEKVNQIILENKPIRHYYLKDINDLKSEKIRKLQEIHEKLRMIEVDKYDLTACGGTHCRHTGEIGIIKITGWENSKDKIRISFLCGYRALADYQKKHQVTKKLSLILTTGIDRLEEKIARLNRENKDLNKQYNKAEKNLLRFETEELLAEGSVRQKGMLAVRKIFSEKSLESLQQIVSLLIGQNKCIAILGAEKPGPVLCFGRSRDLTLHAGALMQKIVTDCHGKGGGSDFLAVGKFERVADMQNAFQKINTLMVQGK